MLLTKYGSPDHFELRDVKKPIPRDDEVLVRVRAVSINEWDWAIVHGYPFTNRVTFGLFKPKKNTILGCDIAGVVENIGKKVFRFELGDEVFGDISASGWGGLAQYVCAGEKVLAKKSSKMSFEEAATIPQAGLLALQGIKKGNIKKGGRVLVNGAGGGAGSFAIQILRSLGTEVTGVDDEHKLKIMRSLGAHHVLDYRKVDFTKTGEKYDFILEVMSRRSPGEYRRVLRPGGACVMLGGSTGKLLRAAFFGSLGKKKVKLLILRPNPRDLGEMNDLYETRKVKPFIDKTFPLEKTSEAFEYYGQGKFTGKIVLTFN